MKNSSKIRTGALVAATAILTLTTSCKKENNDAPGQTYSTPDNGQAVIKMSGTPHDKYSMVNVEVSELAVQYDNGEWKSLPYKAKIYNVINLRHELTATLAENQGMNYGTISKVRITWGYRNSVIVRDNTGEHVYPLVLRESDRSSLIDMAAKVDKESKPVITVNFNSMASVNMEGEGTYFLKPTIGLESVEIK